MSGLTESMENYLRCIHELSYTNKGVRLTDLADKMKVRKASANNAVMKLSKLGYCAQVKYGPIFLTDAGIEAVKAATGKHLIIVKFLKDILMVDEETAEAETTKIEHHLSTSTVYATHQLHSKLKNKHN